MVAFLPAGPELASWLSAGRRDGRPGTLALWSYRWRALWFDKNWRLQERLHPAPAFPVGAGRDLVFVLGFWRSGTTLLHELLALGPGMAAPRTWQCMNPSAFRIAAPPRAALAASRPMDAMVISALSPQEDEFALLARGAPSVYRAWLDPRRWREVLPALSQDTWLSPLATQWLADWRRFLGWCMPPEAATLVVKSPNHVFRLKALRRLWPEARYVWTVRDPAAAWHSNRKMWRAMSRLYGFAEFAPSDLDALLAAAFAAYAEASRWALDHIPPEQLVWLDYDSLTRNTECMLSRLIARLELGPWEAWQPRLQSRLDQSARHAEETYESATALPPSAASLMASVRELHLDAPRIA